jgi:hypothetical protein
VEYWAYFNDSAYLEKHEINKGSIRYIPLPFNVDELTEGNGEWDCHTYNGNKIFVSWASSKFRKIQFILNHLSGNQVEETTLIRILPAQVSSLRNYIKDCKHTPTAGFCNFYYYLNEGK